MLLPLLQFLIFISSTLFLANHFYEEAKTISVKYKIILGNWTVLYPVGLIHPGLISSLSTIIAMLQIVQNICLFFNNIVHKMLFGKSKILIYSYHTFEIIIKVTRNSSIMFLIENSHCLKYLL